MPLLVDLVMLYERQGLTVICGLDSRHTTDADSEFAWLLRGQENLTGHLGIAQKELYFLECALMPPKPGDFARPWSPRGMVIIGNSFGWSSFALAMLCPQAKVVAVEIGADPFTDEWIGRTNAIAVAEGLPLNVVKGASPEAVTAVLGPGGALDGIPLDLVLVDGEHSPAQVTKDLQAVIPFLNDNSVVLCHDAVLFHLTDAIAAVAAKHGLDHSILWNTPSGMAVLTGRRPPLAVIQAAHVFGGSRYAKEMVEWLRFTKQQAQAGVS